jgi:uncharacterized protein YdeI (YjbR/CyaY-like superfamily)
MATKPKPPTTKRPASRRSPPARPAAVRVPADLARALRGSKPARSMFESWPPSHRRQLVRYIDDAKRAETRGRRIEAMVERLTKDWKLAKGRV